MKIFLPKSQKKIKNIIGEHIYYAEYIDFTPSANLGYLIVPAEPNRNNAIFISQDTYITSFSIERTKAQISIIEDVTDKFIMKAEE